jgi:uncharacterized protein YkwD
LGDLRAVNGRSAVTVAVVVVGFLGVVLLPRAEGELVRDVEGCPGSGDVAVPGNLGQTRRAVLCLLNRERRLVSLGPLMDNSLLQAAAQAHSLDMDRRNFYDHRSPDGIEPHTRVLAAGYGGASTGENIHWGVEADATPVRIVRDWMDSRGHRENILRAQFTEIGIGIAHGAPKRGVSGRAAIYTTSFGGPVPVPAAPAALPG